MQVGGCQTPPRNESDYGWDVGWSASLLHHRPTRASAWAELEHVR